MLEVVWSSGVVGRSGRRPPNWEPNESDGRRERLGVGNLGLVLRSDVKEVRGIRWVETEVCGHVSGQGSHGTEHIASRARLQVKIACPRIGSGSGIRVTGAGRGGREGGEG